MAINWNQAEYVAPKLQIVPEQLPLEAGIKVGEVLQNRYDKAIETDTKIGALTKKLMGSVDPKDQELAKEITDTYSARLKDRATTGDYHKMQWQTLADAEDFANIYTGLTEKAKTMQKYRDYIDTNKDVIDPRTKAYQKAEWEKAQGKSTFDKENRFVSGLGVSAPSLVADTDFAKFADSFASGFKADSGGGKKGKTIFTKPGDKLSDGTISAGGAYNEISANKWEKVKDTDIIKALDDYAAASPSLQATIDRDTKASVYYEPLREGETLEQRREMVKRDNMNRAWNAAANKFGYTNSYSDVQSEYNTQLNASLAAKNKVNAPTVVNSLADSYGKDGSVLRRALVNGLEGEAGSLYNIKSWVKNELKTSSASEKSNYQNLNNSLDKIKDLSPEEQQSLANYFQMDIGDALTSLDEKSSLNSPKVKSLFKELNKHIGATISLDTEIERRYNKASKENVGFQNVNMLVPHYNNAEEINQLNTWMKTSLSNNDFKQFKGKLEPEADYQISKVTDRPLGNGTGIVIELKDNKTNKTVLVEPKDDRLLNALEKTFPGISSMNSFKNTSDFSQGERKSINTILEENQIGNTGMPAGQGELEIQYGINPETKEKSNRYYLITPSGRPVKDENGNIKQSTSYIDLL